ncbi:MAG: 50S ribosomal protein L9 [Thermodesulfobacteriota bacterium]
MKVILRSEVENLGAYGDLIKVARGYARNYLIPRGLALEASPGNMRQFEAEKVAWLKKEAKKKEEALALAGRLEALSLTFTRKASEEDKLFGSVTVHDIADALGAEGFEVEKKAIQLAEHIKSLGQFTVDLKLHSGVTAGVKVEVVKEEE